MHNLIKKDNKFIEVQLGVLVFQKDEAYIAYCPALELSTYGDRIGDVKTAFDDLIKSYMEDSIKMGTLEKDLRAHGWDMPQTPKGAFSYFLA